MKKIVCIVILTAASIMINVYCFSSSDSGVKGVNVRQKLMQPASREHTKFIKQAAGQLIGKIKTGNYQCIIDTLSPDLTCYQTAELEKKLDRNCGKDICVTCVRVEKSKNPGVWEAECKAAGGDVIYIKFCACENRLRLYNVY